MSEKILLVRKVQLLTEYHVALYLSIGDTMQRSYNVC